MVDLKNSTKTKPIFETIDGLDFFTMVALIGMVIGTIHYVPKIEMPDSEMYTYLGTFVSEKRDGGVMDFTTHEWKTYNHCVRYNTDDGRKMMHRTNNHIKDYEIREDDKGKVYVYLRNTALNSEQYSIFYFIIMVLGTCTLGTCITHGGSVLRFLRVISGHSRLVGQTEVEEKKERIFIA